MSELSPAERSTVLAQMRALFLERLCQIVQAAGLSQSRALEHLTEGVGQFFDEMTSQSARSGFEQAAGLTASKIRLVDDADLEFSIRLGDLSRRLFDECGVGLAKLHPRLATLLERGDLEAADNPVGPEAVRSGLTELFNAADWSSDQADKWLNEIGNRLAQDLPLVYAEIGELLVRNQVPATRALVQRAAEGGYGLGAERPADSMAKLQMAMAGPMTGGTGGAATGGGSGGAAGLDPTALARGAALAEQLLARLGETQRQHDLDLFGGTATGTADLKDLKSGEVGGLLSGRDAASLDMLAALFEILLGDPQLPDAVKAALGRLQIPLLKAAILDESFFTDPEHPARGFMDAVTRAVMGLDARADGQHPACRAVRDAVAAVQGSFERDPEVFARHSAELETFIARRDHDLQAAVAEYLPLARRVEQGDLAYLVARDAIRGRLMANTPPVIAEFLRTDWRKVLELSWMEGGEEGASWQAARQVLDELLWSVAGKADPEERKRVAAVVPGLLRRLREGLDRVGVTPQSRATFFDACFALQTAVLKGKPLAAEPAAPAAGSADAQPVFAMQTMVESNGRILKSLRAAELSERAPGRRVAALRVGDWVEFSDSAGARYCGRLCWLSPLLGEPLFLNPDWGWGINVVPQVLEAQLAGSQARVCGDRSLFDVAAEKVLAAIKPPR